MLGQSFSYVFPALMGVFSFLILIDVYAIICKYLGLDNFSFSTSCANENVE